MRSRHLSEWKRSGLSLSEFARRHEVSVTEFGWWKRRLSLVQRTGARV